MSETDSVGADATPSAPPRGASGAGATAALFSPHQRDGRFFNPWGRQSTGLREVLRWYRERPWRRPPEQPAPRVANSGSSLRGNEPELALTWVGHSTFAIQHRREVLLTDPHFGRRALVPRRRVLPGLPLEAVPPGSIAILSHNHYDHLDLWTARHLPHDLRWLVPLGLAAPLRRAGVTAVRECDWWEEATEGPFRFICLPAQHWSNRLAAPRNSTLWCSWMIEIADRRLYFAGDSGWFPGFAEYGRRFPGIDAALLPIGAYEPRWFMRYQHLDPAEALAARQALRARWLVGMHWGTFALTDEPLDEPPRALARAVTAAGVAGDRVKLFAVGERWTLA